MYRFSFAVLFFFALLGSAVAQNKPAPTPEKPPMPLLSQQSRAHACP